MSDRVVFARGMHPAWEITRLAKFARVCLGSWRIYLYWGPR